MDDGIRELEDQLNDFDRAVRVRALDDLMALANRDAIVLPEPAELANMHCHTFFSYNGYGFSPAALAWLARRRGYKLMGIVDFDVLDGVDEFLAACDRVGLRGSAGMETRAFVPEFSSREINSPGEPGVYYHMGIGFTSSTVPATRPEAAAILATMRQRAADRNREIIDRVNTYLDPVTVDYESDVIPLTPAGNATERHIVAAYLQAADRLALRPAEFWAAKLELPLERVLAVIDRGPQMQDLVRSKLMKRGGVGYVQPGPASFPTVEEVNAVITACGALPTITWLDGTSEGERSSEELFDLMIAKGAMALNIIPDRNWNIADSLDKERKLAALYDVVALARRLDLPINVGTEMNAYGKPMIDEFDAPELAPVREDFMDGAYFFYGHGALQRALGLGAQSGWAKRYLPSLRDRNRFYTEFGRRMPPGKDSLERLREAGASPTPQDLLGTWRT